MGEQPKLRAPTPRPLPSPCHTRPQGTFLIINFLGCGPKGVQAEMLRMPVLPLEISAHSLAGGTRFRTRAWRMGPVLS